MFTLHIFSVFFSLGVIFVADKQALRWVVGSTQTLSPVKIHRLHIAMWVGLCALVGTGVWMFLPRAGYLLTNPLFVIKLLFVATLIVNGILIGGLQKVALERPFASLTLDEKIPLVMSGLISGFCWVATIVVAFFAFS